MRTIVHTWSFAGASVLMLVIAPPSWGQQSAPTSINTDAGRITATTSEKFFKKPGYSPYAGRNFPTRPYWGDQHLHTS